MKIEHTWHKCNCDNVSCMFCVGGLGACDVCRGFEGTLTTHCCGRPITKKEEKRIYEIGDLDFRDGEWVDKPTFGVLSHFDIGDFEKDVYKDDDVQDYQI